MNRIEELRQYVDYLLLQIQDPDLRRTAYVHIYGVAQFCSLIAIKRKENVELAVMAGMLHDIYSYTAMDNIDHARKGAIMAGNILKTLKLTDDEETRIICDAIAIHSEKAVHHDPFAEVLIDADVLQHCLYNPLFEIMPHEQRRFEWLKTEFQLW